jgi:hypothetical protein
METLFSWNLHNAQTKEKTEELFSSKLFEIRKKRGPTSEESEIREQMAKLLDKSIPYICGRTRYWTKDELYIAYTTAVKWRTNPPALLNKLIKEQNIKIKEMLK